MVTFEEFGLSKPLLESIKKLRIETPTEIQELAIPLVIQGKDVIGESSTGSGKTLVFGCGIIENLKKDNHIQALILTPTRELAEQIRASLWSFTKALNIAAVYGGVSINPQIENLTYADVVVATPGRLLDHMNQRTVDLSRVKLLVLDEADRMLDMGFIRDVEKIVRAIPSTRQTMFFSATISQEIRSLARKYMKNPEIVSATKYVDPTKLKQFYYNVSKPMKLSLLVHILKEAGSKLVMVFCNTRRGVDFVYKNLCRNGIKAIATHGGLTQNKRNQVLSLFNHGKVDAMICTDVAARGLHIDHVTHIVNYDIPKDAKDYVHRIGRTARAGEYGKVINILSDADHENFRRIGYEYENFNIEQIETPKLEVITVLKAEHNDYGRSFGHRREGGRGHGRSAGQRKFGWHRH